MTRAELRDIRIRALTGVPLPSGEQLALVEACERLEEVVRRHENAGGDVAEQDYRTIGREAVAIIREVRLS